METIYLSSWIDFGKYRNNPRRLEDIVKTKEGVAWLKWLMNNTYNFKFDRAVVEHLNRQEENGRILSEK